MIITNSFLVVTLLSATLGALDSHSFQYQSVLSPPASSKQSLRRPSFLSRSSLSTSWQRFGTPSDTAAGDSIPAIKDEVEEEEEQTGGNTETLILRGVISATTKELPAASPETILQFMQQPQYRNLMITAGGKRPVEQFDLTPELVEEWKQASKVVGARYPENAQDSTAAVLKVQTGNINFPGLQLKSVSKLGCKLCYQEGGDEMPVYETTLLGDERTVSGLPPVVFIYNKLTGGEDQKKKDSGGETTTTTKKKQKGTAVTSVSKVTYQRTENNKIVFTVDGEVAVSVQFPAFLLKILPTNKEKAEASGGASISKAVVKEVESALQAFGEAYETFIQK